MRSVRAPPRTARTSAPAYHHRQYILVFFPTLMRVTSVLLASRVLLPRRPAGAPSPISPRNHTKPTIKATATTIAVTNSTTFHTATSTGDRAQTTGGSAI